MVDETNIRRRFDGKPRNWWPCDRYRQEIHVGDYLLFTDYRYYPRPAFGRVIRLGKTGKVHVEIVKTHASDEVAQIEIKECQHMMKISQNMINAITMDKLSA